MRTYRCEDVTLTDKGIDSKGWLCNPREKGKKPAIIILGPKNTSNTPVSLQYATRLANYGYVVLGLEEMQNVKAAIDYLSLKEEVDPDKLYAVGICNGTNEVLAGGGPPAAAIMGCMEPLTAVSMGVLFLGEHFGFSQLLGVLIVLVAVFIVILANNPGHFSMKRLIPAFIRIRK